MAKNAVGDWSTTDSLNTDVGGTNIAEGCAPGGINDAIRKVMAQIATWYASVTTTIAGLMPKTGGTFTGAITGTTATFTSVDATAAGQGSMRISSKPSASGQLEIFNTSFTRVAYIHQPTTGTGANTLVFGKDDGTGFTFVGGVANALSGLQVNGSNVWHAGNLTPSNYALLSGAAFTGGITGTTATFSGTVNAAGLQVSGNAVWHAGNLTPSNYALLSGATFSGAIKRDTNFYLELASSNPFINWDANDSDSFDRTTNKRYITIGGVTVASIDASGNLKLLGNITANAGSV